MKSIKPSFNSDKQPIGHITGNIHRMFLSILNKNLTHLDIERYYYPILLIESGKGNLTQQELAEKLSCDKVHVVRIIDYLSVNGYVNRIRNLRDRRKYGLELTQKARNVIYEIQDAFQKTNSFMLKNLSESQINDLYISLKTIENNLTNF